MTFSERIKQGRKAKGYTQQDMANFLGISKSAYCGYETGRREPDVAKIKMLSRILGIAADDLIGVKSNTPNDPAILQLHAIADSITPQQAKKLLKIAQAYLAEAEG